MTTYALTEDLPRGVVNSRQVSVPAGEAVLLRPGHAAWSLSVVPGNGGTALAEVSVSPPALAPDAMTWHALGSAADSAMLYTFASPVTAIRVSASSAAAVVELAA